MVRTRVLVGGALGAAFVGLLVADSLLPSGAVLYIAVALLIAAGIYEFSALAEQGGDQPRRRWPIVLAALFVAGQYVVLTGQWTLLSPSPHENLLAAFYGFAGLAAAVGFLLLAVDQLLWCEPERYLHDLSVTVLGFFYLWFLGAHVLALRSAWGTAVVVILVAAAKLNDVGAYFTGTFLGRHRFAPKLSPKKTLEGSAGGMIAGALAAVLAAALLVRPPVAMGFWLAFGLVVGLAGQIGDLVESGIKRSVGAKDSNQLLPTFGGALDVIDSVVVSAPVALWFLELWGPGIVPRLVW